MSCAWSSHVVVLTLIIPFSSRGKRLAFQNPHFGAPKNPRSKLQPDHPDFSPSEDCTPRRLFGPPRKGSPKAKAQDSVPTTQGRSPSPTWEGDGEDEDTLGGPPRATLAQEFERIGKAEGGKASGGMVALPKEGTKVVKH